MEEVKKEPNFNEKRPGTWQQEFYSELKMLVAILAAVILVFQFVLQLVVVVGDSMYPTLHNRDILVAWRLNDHLETGDIVVIHKETAAIQETIIKRVIATGGQTVELDYERNAVYIDGVLLEEDYINWEEADPMEETGDVISIDVPEGSVFVMGDNRNHSTDSRFTDAVGMVDEGYIIGKAVVLFFPFTRIKLLEE